MTFSEISMKDLDWQPHFFVLHDLITLSSCSAAALGKKEEKKIGSNCFLRCLISTAELIVYHCCLNLIHRRDLRARRKMDRSHCELCKTKGTLINSGFKCCKSNLQDILIQLHVLLVHLCMKFIVLQQPSFMPLRLLYSRSLCLPLTNVNENAQRSIKNR